ncbi:MAG: PIN domain-containing protein [Rhodothermus sp.]|nr:PIN domain-containing protein [Rhodothermus sp.]
MSVSAYVLDTGPLVALLNRRDRYHHWAVRTVDTLEAPLITCEPVVSEAWFLIRRGGGNPLRLLELMRVLEVHVASVWGSRIEALLRRYADRISVADAALLTLVEAEKGRVIVTTDREDFTVYRIHRRQAVPTLLPPA